MTPSVRYVIAWREPQDPGEPRIVTRGEGDAVAGLGEIAQMTGMPPQAFQVMWVLPGGKNAQIAHMD